MAHDPLAPIRAAVHDPETFALLRTFVERRRQPGSSVDDAVAAVLHALRDGSLQVILRQAAKSEVVWREEQELQRLVLRDVARFRGKRPEEALPEIRRAVTQLCAVRYPRHQRRYITRVVNANVGCTLRRLEIRSERLVEALAGLRPN